MRSPSASFLAAAWALAACAGTLLATGLENGEVQANAQFLSGGAAVGAEQELSMEVRSPGANQFPPLPNAAPALARINATMPSITHLATAGSNSQLGQVGGHYWPLVAAIGAKLF